MSLCPAPIPYHLWLDPDARTGPSHMAHDEAMLTLADRPTLRCYHWGRPELTIGLFTPFAPLSLSPVPVTRRWTGGGIVEHGDDITFALAIPRRHLDRRLRPADWYRWLHETLAGVLRAAGFPEARAAPVPAPGSDRPGFCFEAPVAWDLVRTDSGRKIAGGAQRHSRAGLLHQGSLRLPAAPRENARDWRPAFAEALAGGAGVSPPPPGWLEEVSETAASLERSRYADPRWLFRR